MQKRGIDVRALDSRIEKKAEIPSLTRDQEVEVEAVRTELTKAEAAWREANEKELPEEVFRLRVEEKRKELNDLMEKFSSMNVVSGESVGKKSGWNVAKDRRKHHAHTGGSSRFSNKPWNEAR